MAYATAVGWRRLGSTRTASALFSLPVNLGCFVVSPVGVLALFRGLRGHILHVVHKPRAACVSVQFSAGPCRVFLKPCGGRVACWATFIQSRRRVRCYASYSCVMLGSAVAGVVCAAGGEN